MNNMANLTDSQQVVNRMADNMDDTIISTPDVIETGTPCMPEERDYKKETTLKRKRIRTEKGEVLFGQKKKEIRENKEKRSY